MYFQILNFLVTNNPAEKKKLSEEMVKYGATPYGIINTISQLVDEESLEFINRFFNNWNTLSGSKTEDILDYIDRFYKLGFIKFIDRELINKVLSKLQYVKTIKDEVEVIVSKLPYKFYEEKKDIIKDLSRYNNEELKLLRETEEFKNFMENLSKIGEVEVKREVKKNKEEEKQLPVKEIYEKIKQISSTVTSFKNENNCLKCPLYNRTFVGIDYNISDPDKPYFDIVFVGEAPGVDESKKGKPFVGKSGQFLRKNLIEEFKDCNYIITNTCMCHPDRNLTPSDDAIVSCNKLLKKILSISAPKIVVSLGDTSLKGLIGFENYKIFKGKHGGIVKNNGRYIKTEEKSFPIVVTFHPSYVIRNGSDEKAYDQAKKTIKQLLSNKEESSKPIIYKNNLLYYKLNEKLFEPNVSILDVQTGKKEVFILYRENSNTNIISIPKINYGYIGDTKEWLKDASKVKPTTDIGIANYEIDFSYSNKVMVDWKIERESRGLSVDSSDFDWAIVDIEVYTETNEFPKPEEAKFPVVLASIYSSIDNKIHVFSLNEAKFLDNIEVLQENFKIEYHNFSDEKELLKSLMNNLLKHDVITAWNIGFDIGYIYNRFFTIGFPVDKIGNYFSAIEGEEPYINVENGTFKIPGKIIVDLLTSYRMFSPGEKESFSLGYISSIELGVTKTTAGSNFSKLWEQNVEKAIEYNCYDVALCYLINKKLDILNFLNELRFIANSSWQEYQYKGTLIDGLLLYYAKKSGKVLHNKYRVNERSYLGGYVYQPISGRHEIVQFDFSSQYPSIILTLNVGYESFYGIFSTPNDYKIYYYYLFSQIDGEKEVSFKFFNQETREFEEKVIRVSDLEKLFKENKITIGANGACFKNTETSLVKKTVDEVIKKRKQFKNLFAETGDSKYNAKQYTYKILANSVYGVIGDSKSRMYMPDIAESITVTGQISNKTVATGVEKFYDKFQRGENFEENDIKEIYLSLLSNSYEYNKDIPERNKVVYGDTDSIFIKVSDKSVSSNFENSINNLLNLLSEKVFRSTDNKLKVELKYYGLIYLTEVKKRYCVYIPDTDELEVKGMEMVKADYPIFFKEKMKELFYLILKENLSYEKILEFIDKVDKESKSLYMSLDKKVGKPVTLQKDEYKSLSPAARGMTFYNSVFGKYFQLKSKGILFQVKPLFEKLGKDVKDKYYEYLKELVTDGAKFDVTREEKNMKWICIPFEEDEVLIQNIQKIKELCIPDASMVDRYWKDRLREYGVI